MGVVKPPYFVLTALALTVSAPMLVWGIWPGHDAIHHARWLDHFARQLAAGDLYPRWLNGVNHGYGSPTFFFYGPVPCWLTVPWMLLFDGPLAAWQALGWGVAAALAASGAAMFSWLRRITDERWALFAAAVYLLAPYHVAIDAYERAAYAEVWAFVWMPLVLAGIERSNVTRTAIASALLLMTHLPTAFVFAPLAAAYCAVRRDWRAALGGIVGLALAGAYVLPALSLRPLVAIATMFRFQERSFVFESLSGFGGRLTMAAAITLALALVAGWAAGRSGVLWAAGAAAAALLACPLSLPLWQHAPGLASLQFPFRWLSLATLCAAAALGHAQRQRRVAAFFGLLLVIAGAAETARFVYRQYPATLGHPGWQQAVSRVHAMARDPYEYLPETATLLRDYRSEQPLLQLDAIVAAQPAKIERLPAGPREARFRVAAQQPGLLRLPLLAFPLWMRPDRDLGIDVPVEVAGPDGLAAVPVLPGSQDIALRLETTAEEWAGWAFTAAAALGLAAARLIRRAAPPSSRAPSTASERTA
jgi:hypothetical protein